ncbi:PEP-CTERM sorting domain-containing protein [Vibrio sp.]|uniref:PEP-CTERM sorting domain-containing protein n=1 Tax=Vibrio sp. TaxID=678 RepID=UPI003D0EFF1B
MIKLFIGLLLSFAIASTANAFIITSKSGDLIAEFVSSEAASAYIEFGIGTPSIDSEFSHRNALIVRDGVNIISGTTVNAGYVAAGTKLDFYMKTIFHAESFWSFTTNLLAAPTASDLVSFSDADNSLGFGGSIVQPIGRDNWIFHMDDPASICCDDDDDDLVVRIRINPKNDHVPVPEPGTFLLLMLGLAGIGMMKKRNL